MIKEEKLLEESVEETEETKTITTIEQKKASKLLNLQLKDEKPYVRKLSYKL